ncbi:MAG: NADH-quinone oxidoreductase subunit J [Rickettsiales bacterium]|nr:NADH-quinone oxidoreductase subunit J [Rickettsiales bacterium]
MAIDLHSAMFYVFAFMTLMCGVMVISARNPVHSVLFLIFAFFNAAGLVVLMGVEYIAMTLVIVYVGAVAVLFLFVVMMLNINFTEWRQGFLRYLPIGVGVAALFFVQIGALYIASKPAAAGLRLIPSKETPALDQITNTEAVGRLLYTDYFFAFQIAGLILLVAMVSAIVLTLRSREGVLRQRIAKQVSRRRKDGVEMVRVVSGEGISL